MVLVLRPGALGDTLLAVPALRALRRCFGSVTLAAQAAASRLLVELGEVDRGLSFDDQALAWIFGGPARAAHERVAPAEHEPAAAARQSVVAAREPVVAWLAPASAPPGLADALLVAPGRPPRLDRHCAQYLLETLVPLGCELEFSASQAAPLRVRPLVSDEVLLHPGSGSAAKNWPAEAFAALIRGLGNVQVRLIVGEADAAAAAAVERALGRRLPRLEQPGLGALAAALAGCRAYVGNDSGVSHLAGLCGARSVVLFGPTDPTVWRPLGPRVIVAPFEAEISRLRDALLG